MDATDEQQSPKNVKVEKEVESQEAIHDIEKVNKVNVSLDENLAKPKTKQEKHIAALTAEIAKLTESVANMQERNASLLARLAQYESPTQ